MNAANLAKAAELSKMLNNTRYAMQRNTKFMDSSVGVCGYTPFYINHGACAAMLTALEAHLIAELTALGVTELETT